MASREEILAAREAAGETNPEHDRNRNWAPPVQDERDGFLQPPRSYMLDSIDALAEPSGVFVPGVEPGGSEYSWGRGLMAPPGMKPPSAFEEKQAIMRTNPADPSATADYEVTDHSHSADGKYIARVREAEQEWGQMP